MLLCHHPHALLPLRSQDQAKEETTEEEIEEEEEGKRRRREKEEGRFHADYVAILDTNKLRVERRDRCYGADAS